MTSLPHIRVFVGSRFPDPKETPVNFGVVIAWSPEIKDTCSILETPLQDAENAPDGLYLSAIIVGCAASRNHQKDNPGHAYSIHVTSERFVKYIEEIDEHEKNGWVDKEGAPVPFKDLRLQLKEVLGDDIELVVSDEKDDFYNKKAAVVANQKFIENVSRVLHFPKSVVSIPVHDLSAPFYTWDLGTGASLVVEKSDPYEKNSVTTGYFIDTPASMSKRIFRSIRVRDVHAPKDQDEHASMCLEHSKWKAYKEEARKEFYSKRQRFD